jgi:hypothetical protein
MGYMKAKTHCLRGHPYDNQNTLIRGDGFRACRACARTRSADRHRRLRVIGAKELANTPQSKLNKKTMAASCKLNGHQSKVGK